MAPSSGRAAFGSNWLAGLVLGAVNGTALVSLGFLILPLLLASLLLIAWKGPRLTAGSGFLTGLGLIWTVLFLRVALTCGGPLDPGTSTCVAGDLTGWLAFTSGVLVVGLAVSAAALARQR